MIRVVALDLGGVLSWPPDLYTAPAALLGVDPAAYEAAYWPGRHDLDLGRPPGEYYADLLKGVGLVPSGGLVDHLAHYDISLWCRLRPTAAELLRELAGREQRLVILSNAPATLRDAAEQSDWYPLVERIFISAELGLVKPDHRLYSHVTAELGVGPEEIAFIDDREDNVAGAEAFGWHAHLWRDDADSAAWLREVCAAPSA